MKITLTIIAFFFLTSCSDDNPLIPKKLYKHLAFFKQNDTLVFKSDRNDVDTFLITRVDSGFCKKTVFVHEECETFINVYYKKIPFRKIFGKFEIPDTSDKVLFSLIKYPKNSTEVSISFIGFHCWGESTFGIQKKDTVINNFKFKNIYILVQTRSSIIDHTLPDSLYAEKIIWTDSIGIIAYTCANGSKWTRIMNNGN